MTSITAIINSYHLYKYILYAPIRLALGIIVYVDNEANHRKLLRQVITLSDLFRIKLHTFVLRPELNGQKVYCSDLRSPCTVYGR